MATKNSTLAQLANAHGLERKAVRRAARKVLDDPKIGRNDDYSLNAAQQARVLNHLGIDRDAASAAPKPQPAPAPTPEAAPLVVPSDPPERAEAPQPRALNHAVWLHGDLLIPQPTEPLTRRLTLVLSHLGVMGRTTVVKGCRGQGNERWKRSPLGGNGGFQYYLWWARADGAAAAALGCPEGAVLARAVRHHDDHRALALGVAGDFLPLETGEALESEPELKLPWTDPQLAFVDAADPVRVVHGRPGSGKTSALHRMIRQRAWGTTLYLTWSGELVEQAAAYFAAFGDESARVVPLSYGELLGRILGEPPAQPAADGVAALQAALARLSPRLLGPWADRWEALHGELRAHLLGGRLDPAPTGLTPASDYNHARRRAVTYEGVGGVHEAYSALEQAGTLDQVFPELCQAHRALSALAAGGLPQQLQLLDRIVVDEVQDLTGLEQAVVVALMHAVAAGNVGVAPSLAVAGDEGQTVRATGFEWGGLKDLLHARLGHKPREFILPTNLRAPQRLAEVVARASEYYRLADKDLRPSKQRRSVEGQHTEAACLHADVPDQADANTLVEALLDLDDVAVIAAEAPPAWLSEELAEQVLTPAQAKGLEYQRVCLLGVAELLLSLHAPRGHAVDELAARTRVDRLRVALSRSTEVLAVLDVAAAPEGVALSRALLAAPALMEPEDLVEELSDRDASPEERLEARLRDARELVARRPLRAWRRAVQAVRLLGEAGRPNAVADPDRRVEAHEVLVACAVELCARANLPARLTLAEMDRAVATSLDTLASAEGHALWETLKSWVQSESAAGLTLLEVAIAAPRPWQTALAPARPALLDAVQRGALKRATAPAYGGAVRAWLEFTRFAGDLDREARALREAAVDTLLEDGAFGEAAAVAAWLQPPDLARQAQILEGLGEYADAARAYGKLGDDPGACRCWRKAGRWAEAANHARHGSAEARDLQWLLRLDRLAERLPDGFAERLTDMERQALGRKLRALRRDAGGQGT